ncbi:MAG: hypothetical protein ACRDJI_03450, partial [Actinomycetota bacterium]
TAADLERELERLRSGEGDVSPSNAVRLSVEEALAFRNAGNLPDDNGRTLRLVLRIDDASELSYLQAKRLVWEPDFHDAPEWRRAGSRPVNVVPLRAPGVTAGDHGPWWEESQVAALEDEWRTRGTAAGLKVPASCRGFVYKTVLALRAAGREVTPDSVADSISRWVPAPEADQIRSALRDANID